jgi:integrase
VDGRPGKSPKTVRNVMGTMHSIFELALQRNLIAANPCQLIELPAVARDTDIRFLDHVELEALLRPAPDRDRPQSEFEWWRVERVLYLAAAMTGLRQSELLALRWCDIDWLARRARVRRSFVRGEFGAPKSKRSTRSVPLATRLMRELELLFQASVWDGDEDLVFANPHTGRPMDRTKLLKRFKAACRRAGVRPVRFHDLRHTFGTRMAACEHVSMRTLQEWMGHRDFATTLIYADYQPGERESELVDAAFAPSASRLRNSPEPGHRGWRAR